MVSTATSAFLHWSVAVKSRMFVATMALVSFPVTILCAVISISTRGWDDSRGLVRQFAHVLKRRVYFWREPIWIQADVRQCELTSASQARPFTP